MWATASLIKRVGCDNVHLDCASTDVAYVMASYIDGGVDLAPAKSCLTRKCVQSAGTSAARTEATAAPSKKADSTTSTSQASSQPSTVDAAPEPGSSSSNVAILAGVGIVVAIVAAGLVLLGHRYAAAKEEGLTHASAGEWANLEDGGIGGVGDCKESHTKKHSAAVATADVQVTGLVAMS